MDVCIICSPVSPRAMDSLHQPQNETTLGSHLKGQNYSRNRFGIRKKILYPTKSAQGTPIMRSSITSAHPCWNLAGTEVAHPLLHRVLWVLCKAALGPRPHPRDPNHCQRSASAVGAGDRSQQQPSPRYLVQKASALPQTHPVHSL